MRNLCCFLQRLLMIGGLCLVVNILYAQDSNKISPVHHPPIEENKRPSQKDSNASRLHDAGKPASVQHIPAERDTFLKRGSSTKTATGSKMSSIPDSLHRNRKFSSLPARPDTGLNQHADTLQRKKAVVYLFTLPSFTSHAFDDYRSFVNFLLTHNSIFRNTSENQRDEIVPLIRDDNFSRVKNELFYIILGVLFLLAILRLSFTKYFVDLFRAFFNPTLSRRQLREQLSQTPLPALMFNIFFTVSAGLYVFLILRHFNYITVTHPLILIPLFIIVFMIIYLVKFIFLRFSGWLFGYSDVASGYIFTLYMVNKILGVGLLPFILVLAFSTPSIAAVALDISLIWIVVLFIYRYIRIFGLAGNKIIFNKFHFFIYLCAFEIAPVLIIGKLVLIWLNGA